jgi:hypothetical protein
MAPDFIKMIKSMFGVEEKLNFSPGLFFGSLGVMTGLLGSANSLGTSIMGQKGFEDLRGDVMKNTKTRISNIGSGIKDKVGIWNNESIKKRTRGTTPPLSATASSPQPPPTPPSGGITTTPTGILVVSPPRGRRTP